MNDVHDIKVDINIVNTYSDSAIKKADNLKNFNNNFNNNINNYVEAENSFRKAESDIYLAIGIINDCIKNLNKYKNTNIDLISFFNMNDINKLTIKNAYDYIIVTANKISEIVKKILNIINNTEPDLQHDDIKNKPNLEIETIKKILFNL